MTGSSNPVSPSTNNSSPQSESNEDEIVVIIDVNLTDTSLIDKDEIISIIADVAGIDPSAIISVDIEVDKGGYIDVIIRVSDDKTADQITSYINEGHQQESSNVVVKHMITAKKEHRSRRMDISESSQLIYSMTMSMIVMCILLLLLL